MAKSGKNSSPGSIAQNRRARHDYFIEDKFEAGLMLMGWEVKSIRDGKAAFYAQIEMPLSDAFKHANAVMCDAVTTTSDAEEGRAAFFEKRKPVWTKS